MFGIKFCTKKSLGAYVYLPQGWSEELKRLIYFKYYIVLRYHYPLLPTSYNNCQMSATLMLNAKTECLMRPTENDMSLSHNFFPLMWHFFHLLLWQHWCCFGIPLWAWWFYSNNMNTLFVWNCETKVDDIHFTALIYQNLEISGFCVPSVWVINSHQHTDITTWNKAK